MNQNADALFKLIIPGIFLLLWVLGQLANRENPTARGPRRPLQDPLGPRPDRIPPTGASSPSPALDSGRGLVAIDPRTGRPAGVVFIESESDPRASRARSGRQSPRRGESGRGRKPAPASQPRSSASPSTPLAGPLSTPSWSADPSASSSVEALESPATSAAALRDILQNPQRVREALVASQVLGPPPGLARLRRFH